MQAKFLDLNEIQEYFEKENWKKKIESNFEKNPVNKEFGIGFCREFLKNSVKSVIPLKI